MAILQDMFGAVVLRHGTGWPAVHVELRQWCSQLGSESNPEGIYLTADAENPNEFQAYIDELKDQLEALKPKGRRMLEKAKRDATC